jgi:cytochrome c biogenesis protein CcdA
MWFFPQLSLGLESLHLLQNLLLADQSSPRAYTQSVSGMVTAIAGTKCILPMLCHILSGVALSEAEKG